MVPDLSDIEEYKYRAFITYAHKDEERARWLRRKLESFRVPKHLVGESGDFGKVPERLYPIFRDRDELAGGAQLGPLIEQALVDSSHLIILCSPQAVRSRWVNEEIRMFKAMGKSDRVLCLVLSGEPMVEDLHGDSEKECLPLAARREVDSNGLITDQTHEPAAADLRETGDGQKDALLKIIAGLLGLGLDDLKQRHLIAKQRRMARIASVSAFLAFSAIALAAYAFYQQSQASIERTNAEIERRATADELAKTQAITNFVQNLFFSLDPEHTARKDTELIKTMLDQGSKRAGNELSGEPEIEAKIRLCLAKTYRSILLYDEAEKELDRVIELFESELDGDLPIRMEAMSEIAMVHDALGNYVEAQPTLLELLKEREQKLGPDHDDVIRTQINLAIVYRRIGKVEQAENQCSECLSTLKDQNRTDDDPLLLSCMQELSKIYLAGEKFAQGESLARNVYEKKRIRWGEKNADSLRAGQILVEALRQSKKLDEAEELSFRIVKGLESALGSTHPDTLAAADSQAGIFAARDNLEDALQCYVEILARKEEALGAKHPETLATLQAKARIYEKLDRLGEAETAQTMVRDRLLEKHGQEHPETLRAMNELSDLFLALGKNSEAFFLSEEALEIEIKVMGEEDPMTLKTMFRIGKLQYLEGNIEGAMEILGETLAKQEKLLGFDHTEATSTRDLLNQILGEKTTSEVRLDGNESGPELNPEEENTPLLVFLQQFERDGRSFEDNSSSENGSLPSQEIPRPEVAPSPSAPSLNPAQPEDDQKNTAEEDKKKGGFFRNLIFGEASDGRDDDTPETEE